MKETPYENLSTWVPVANAVEVYSNTAVPWEVYQGLANYWYGRRTITDSTLEIGPYDTKEDAMSWCARIHVATDFLVDCALITFRNYTG